MMNNCGTVTIETERLLLRPLKEDDFEAVQSYAGNYDNVRFMTWGPNEVEQTKAFIKNTIDKAAAIPRTDYDFAVTLKKTGRLIGACGIYIKTESTEGNVGWILHINYWKKGYGTELAGALIRYGFEVLRLHRITAFCFTENYGSYRIMERNRMRREGLFRQCHKGRPCDPKEWYDLYHYAILKDEWRDNNVQG